MEFHLYVPQMRHSMAALTDRARLAESAGFGGMALMDHMAPPMAFDQPMYEAMTTATVLACHTERLRLGHLVLCDAFRHPAVLARQAVTLSDASGGRFDLGIGWGSVPSEFERFGTGSTQPAVRVRRLAETLEVVTSLWSGEKVDFSGEFHTLRGAQQLPVPTDPIPIVIGGVGPATLRLVARYADWWNVPSNGFGIDELGSAIEERRPSIGHARASVQQMVTYVAPGDDEAEIERVAARRFGWSLGRVTGGDEALIDHFGRLADIGVERVYVWFTDFAAPETIEAFASGVIAAMGSTAT